MKVLIIVPCFNEQVSLPNLLSELSAIDLPAKYQIELSVVNDCSKDDTGKIATRQHITLIDLPINLGIGGAVQSGLKYALKNDFDLAIQVDGDGQHPPAEIIKLLSCHESTGANVVIGSRFIVKQGFQSTFMRRMGIVYFHWLNKFFTGKNIYDSTSGFRLFDKKAIRIAANYYPDDYPEPESLIVFAKAGLLIKETPVVMSARNGGISSIRTFTTIYYCLKVTIAMFFSSIRKP